MSQPQMKPAGQLKEPPITDPFKVETVYANEIIGIEGGNGNVVLTVGERRMMPRKMGQAPEMDLLMTARIAFSGPAAEGLLSQLDNLRRAIQHQQNLASAGAAPQAPPKPH